MLQSQNQQEMLVVRGLNNSSTNNLNFPSPDTEIGYWQLASSCDGISEACNILETPVKEAMCPYTMNPKIKIMKLLLIYSSNWNGWEDR